MIRLVDGNQPGRRDLDAMFCGRKKVFVDRLKWPLSVTERGHEVDEFDALHPLYVIADDDAGHVTGSMRLMPTTGPTLLSGPFQDAFDEPVDIRSATIWDVTRFCVHPDARETTVTGMNRVTSELCQGLAEIGLLAGLTHIIGLYDERMVRVYQRIGWQPERLATSRPGRPDVVYVGLWDVSQLALETMRERSGVSGSVLHAAAATTASLRMVG